MSLLAIHLFSSMNCLFISFANILKGFLFFPIYFHEFLKYARHEFHVNFPRLEIIFPIY